MKISSFCNLLNKNGFGVSFNYPFCCITEIAIKNDMDLSVHNGKEIMYHGDINMAGK